MPTFHHDFRLFGADLLVERQGEDVSAHYALCVEKALSNGRADDQGAGSHIPCRLIIADGQQWGAVARCVFLHIEEGHASEIFGCEPVVSGLMTSYRLCGSDGSFMIECAWLTDGEVPEELDANEAQSPSPCYVICRIEVVDAAAWAFFLPRYAATKGFDSNILGYQLAIGELQRSALELFPRLHDLAREAQSLRDERRTGPADW